jgi:MFS family permease
MFSCGSACLGALATFGVGFITRPLGAAIIGPYADRVGRRAALTLTLLLNVAWLGDRGTDAAVSVPGTVTFNQ